MLPLRWVLAADGLLALLLAVLFVVPRFAPRLKPSRSIYEAGALLAFGGWVAYWVAIGLISSFSGRTVGIAVRGGVGVDVFAASVLLPIESGLLGRAAIRSRWRWVLITASVLVSFPPFLLFIAAFWMR
ncbi:MAG TPA: hypothetical protein VFL79_07015 [Terriglobia bacterium]|nr:hypothetical protein [Terriglobia bacterium]